MLYNKFLENIILPIGDIALGNTFIKNLKWWRKTCQLSEEELANLQKSRLNNILKYSTENIPYYKGLNTTPQENPYEWIKQFPILYKKTMKGKEQDFINGDMSQLIKCSSSGSSGIQGTVYLNKNDQSIARAIQILWWEWAGYKIGRKFFQTGMTPKRGLVKSIKDKLFRTKYYVAFGLSEKESTAIIRDQEGKKGYGLGGYASSLFVLAQLAKNNNVKNVHFDHAISWGDKMFPHYRKVIEEQFSTKVYDTYGCAEHLMIGAQCDNEYYYMMSPHVYIEIVDKDGNEVPDGEMGYVLVTRLDNEAMPLIRYYLGDLAIKLPREKYPKNRKMNFPMLEKVVGRDTDIVITPGGKFLIVHFFTGIFEFAAELKQFKVVQKETAGIEVEYIKDEGFTPAVLDKLTAEMQEYIKEPNFKIEYKEVDFIAPTKSGKPQIIQSFLDTKPNA